MVGQAQARKAPIQGLADAVAGRFSLAVLLLAAATFLFWWRWGSRLWPWVLTAQGASGHGGHGMAAVALSPLALALQLAIAVLVVACPCALGLATPTAITVGLGLAARSGLLFRGGDAMEAAASLKTVLFDKTGTLTTGCPLVTTVTTTPLVLDGKLALEGITAKTDSRVSADRLVQLAASLEQASRHPFAHALHQEAQNRKLPLLDLGPTEVVPGDGLVGFVDGVAAKLRVGRPEWLADQGVLGVTPLASGAQNGGSLLAVAADEVLLGWIGLEDLPRDEALATLASLRAQGLRLGLLSGDRQGSVQRLASEVALATDELAWDLRPEQKLQRILLAQETGPVAMVGDGINDAPALAAADLGVAVGTGTQIAQEAADLVILGDRLGGLPTALALSRRTMAKVRQNLFWAFGYNLLVLPIAAGLLLPFQGIRLTPPLAALLMAMSSITVVLNAVLLQDGSCTGGGIHREP
jgi:Cu2+-exporting ATPase